MRHAVFGKKLNRTIDERRRLFRALVSSFIKYGKLETTKARAKAIKPLVEKLVTKAKRGTTSALREVESHIPVKSLRMKFLKEIVPLYNKRQSGYTRIVRTGQRSGDNTMMVSLQWVEDLLKEKIEAKKEMEKEPTKKSRKKS